MELLVLGLVATIGFASYALWNRSREDQGAAPPMPALEAPDRTPHTLEVGDVVQHLGTDYVVEGALTLSDDGEGARLYRLADGSAERFLYAQPGEDDPLLLDAVPALAAVEAAGAPQAVVHAGQSFQLKSRATASVLCSGVFGERRSGDRVGLLEYTAATARLLVLIRGDHADAFVGERVAAHLLELLPGK